MNNSESLLEKLEELFGEEPFNLVEEELFKWFLFAYLGKGDGIRNLGAVDFEAFKKGMIALIDSIYQHHNQ